MRRLVIASATGLALSLAALASCDNDRPLVEPYLPGMGPGVVPPYDAGPGDARADAPSDTPADAGNVGVAPVLLGITPTPRGDRDGAPTAGDLLAAELTTFAAGVRGVVVSRRLEDLDGDDADLTRLGGLYARHRKRVLFNLALVDRTADGRPDALADLAWDDPAVAAAVEGAIDAVLPRFGDTLAYLTFGRDADVYLAAHPDAQGAFARLATRACAYALASPGAPPGLHAGVGLSSGAVTAPEPLLDEPTRALLAAGDVTVLSYLPGLEAGQASPTSDVVDALDAMIRRSVERPIVLQAVGYPSAPEAGGSEEKQRLFFQTFFDALAPRRSAFAFVNVAELHDPSPAACAALAASQGAPQGGAFARFACSLGLFGQGEASRAAWLEVLDGAATFASP